MDLRAGFTMYGVMSHKSSNRRLTTARREQNRQAQKKFRAKRRARRELPQELAEAASTLATENLHVAASSELNVEQIHERIYNSEGQREFHQRRSCDSHLHAVEHACTVDRWTKDGLVRDPVIIQRLGEENWPPLTTSTGNNLPRILTPLAPAILFPADPSTVDMRAMWPIPMRCFQEAYSPPQQFTRTMQDQPAQKSLCRWSSVPEQAFSASHSVFIPKHSFQSQECEAILPCPHKNYIQLMGESCFAATMAIATHLGITRSAYINDHPSLFPLNSSTVLGNGLQLSQLAPDLQPTHKQKTLAHPNFLDCIIFPRFRSRAIEASSRGELDLCSLFLDLMHDGLICWGSQCLGTQQARSRTEGGWESMRGGVPWDGRSWEARPWFLRKWSFLVGDDDPDGMSSGSEWWQCIRGEVDGGSSEEMESKEAGVDDQGAIFSRYGGCNVGIRQTVENDALVVWNGEQWAFNKDSP